MDTKFERIEGGARRLVLLSAGLGALVLAGVWSTWRMHVEGVFLSGMTNRIPWGLQIVLGIFYIGLSAGSLVISSLYGLFGRGEYRPFARVAAFAAVLLMVGALLSIVSDQGRIDRVFVQPFLHLNPLSMLSINPFLYASYVLVGVAYLTAMMLESERWTRALALLAVLWAVLVHSGTGAIFGFVPRELYRSPLLPPSFVAAALSSGTALMILVLLALFRLTRRRLDDELILWVARILGVFVLVAAYFVLVENVHRLYLHESREAARFLLFGGPHAALFWVGMVLLGTVVPAALLFGRGTRGSVRRVAVASALVVLGVLCERYLVVIPGLAFPPELLPGWRIARSGFEEGIATYAVSGYELLQALGVLGLVVLLFTWGLKLMPLLPTEARAHPRDGTPARGG